jgi:hypothetical protein
MTKSKYAIIIESRALLYFYLFLAYVIRHHPGSVKIFKPWPVLKH